MIVALAGRRVDAADAAEPRFPLANADTVRERVQTLLRERGAGTLVASAACGADLAAHEAAGALGLRRVVVLPFPPAVFRVRSVTDRPGDWGPQFDALVADAQRAGTLVVLDTPDDEKAGSRAYAQTNAVIVERALAMAAAAGEAAMAVAVWDEAERPGGDMTADFVHAAEARGLAVEHVSTR